MWVLFYFMDPDDLENEQRSEQWTRTVGARRASAQHARASPCTRIRRRPKPARLLHAVRTRRGHLARALPAAAAELPAFASSAGARSRTQAAGGAPLLGSPRAGLPGHPPRPRGPCAPRPRAPVRLAKCPRAPPLAHLSPPGCMRQRPAGRLTSALRWMWRE